MYPAKLAGADVTFYPSGFTHSHTACRFPFSCTHQNPDPCLLSVSTCWLYRNASLQSAVSNQASMHASAATLLEHHKLATQRQHTQCAVPLLKVILGPNCMPWVGFLAWVNVHKVKAGCFSAHCHVLNKPGSQVHGSSIQVAIPEPQMSQHI